MDAPTLDVMNELRAFMFERVYLLPGLREHTNEAVDVLRRLIDHHLDTPTRSRPRYRDTDADLITQVVDYVAGMTDRYALRTHERLFGTPGMTDPPA